MSRLAVRAHKGVLGAAVLLIAVAVAATVAWTGGSSDDRAPYRDPAAAGSIGLCDRSGHQRSSGSVAAKPFVWRAVGSTPAPAAYARSGRSATLYVFQPRAGVPADEWSGRMLTAASFYTRAAHPMAAATAADVALGDFLAGYPPQDDGFVQLRLYLSAPGLAPLTSQYDALDLKIDGTTWRAVNGRRLSCSTGSSVSFETVVHSSTHS
jgi:membrane protein implicated in regulation of membrane protease activity